MRFWIGVKFPSLNEYINAERINRFCGAKMKRDYTDIVKVATSDSGAVTAPVSVTCIWHEKTKRRDKDNVAFAKKFVLDGLQASGVLPNDNNGWVVSLHDEFAYDGKQGVEIILAEALQR